MCFIGEVSPPPRAGFVESDRRRIVFFQEIEQGRLRKTRAMESGDEEDVKVAEHRALWRVGLIGERIVTSYGVVQPGGRLERERQGGTCVDESHDTRR